MSSSLEQTIDRLATKDVCQHINYQYNHCLFLSIFVAIIDGVFLFHLNIPMELYFKEHFIFVYLVQKSDICKYIAVFINFHLVCRYLAMVETVPTTSRRGGPAAGRPSHAGTSSAGRPWRRSQRPGRCGCSCSRHSLEQGRRSWHQSADRLP